MILLTAGQPAIHSANIEDWRTPQGTTKCPNPWLSQAGMPVRSDDEQIRKRKIIERQLLIRAVEREKV